MFDNTRGSLIPGALMHLSINFTATALGVADSAVLYSLTVAVLVFAAIVVVSSSALNVLVASTATSATRCYDETTLLRRHSGL